MRAEFKMEADRPLLRQEQQSYCRVLGLEHVDSRETKMGDPAPTSQAGRMGFTVSRTWDVRDGGSGDSKVYGLSKWEWSGCVLRWKRIGVY